MKTSRKDINEMITQRLIERIRKTGELPWKKPWSSPGLVPRNLLSGKPYRGANTFLLHAMGYASPHWLTIRQANALGGKIRKGEHACPVVFWKFLGDDEQEQEETTERKRYALLRYYSVFNVTQCEGLPEERVVIPATETKSFDPVAEAERLVREMPDPPQIRYDSRRASYNPQRDLVRMPPREHFSSAGGFYDALFHELLHATGHERRLNRKGVTQSTAFGSDPYSAEELVAEMGSAFLLGECGLLKETEQNNAAYLKHWIERLKADPGLLVKAGSQAQKAYDWITTTQPEPAAATLGAPLFAGICPHS